MGRSATISTSARAGTRFGASEPRGPTGLLAVNVLHRRGFSFSRRWMPSTAGIFRFPVGGCLPPPGFSIFPSADAFHRRDFSFSRRWMLSTAGIFHFPIGGCLPPPGFSIFPSADAFRRQILIKVQWKDGMRTAMISIIFRFRGPFARYQFCNRRDQPLGHDHHRLVALPKCRFTLSYGSVFGKPGIETGSR
jgi:hypothetical protein